MAMHPVVVSIIFIFFENKILLEVLHFVYHTIGVLEDMIIEVVYAIFDMLFTIMGRPSIDDLYFPPAEMAMQEALKLGELLVAGVVLYAGAKVGLNLVWKLAVNPVENIREYLVDPIQEYVEEKSAEHNAVLEKYVVTPIGDCVAETIKNYVLAPIRKYRIEMAPIREYVPALIREYVLAPIQEYVVAPIQRLSRKLRYKKKIRKVRAQIGNLRKITEVVVKAVDAAQENREVTLPNVTEWLPNVAKWLTSADGITEESMSIVEQVVEIYFEHLEPLKSKRD